MTHRIALLTQGFRISGGVRTVALWLVDRLREEGYVVDVHDVTASSVDPASRRVSDPRTWTRGSLRGTDDDGVTTWGANAVELEPFRYLPRAELTSALSQYDLVQVVAGGPSLALAASRTRRPVVLQVATRVTWERAARQAQGMTLRGAVQRGYTQATSWMEPHALRSVSHVMVENDEMAAYVRSVGQHNVTKAPPGVDTDRFTPSPDGWMQEGPLLSVCRLADPRKGLDRMVRAYGEYRSLSSAPRPLVMAGRGDLPPEIQALIDQLGLRDVIDVRRDIPAESLAPLLRSAAVFLQTSHEEGLGLSVVEAMASGAPVVSTTTAGAAECVADGETGRLVPQPPEGTLPRRFAEAIVDVEARGAQMAGRARERAERLFSTNATMSSYQEVYARLLR